MSPLGIPLGNPQHRLVRPASGRTRQRRPRAPGAQPLCGRHPGTGRRGAPMGARRRTRMAQARCHVPPPHRPGRDRRRRHRPRRPLPDHGRHGTLAHLSRARRASFQSDDAGTQPSSGTVAGPPNRTRADRRPAAPRPYRSRVHGQRVGRPGAAGLQRSLAIACRIRRPTWISTRSTFSPETRLFTARAAQAMGTPETSNYLYHPVVWRRTPQNDTTCVDLVFEPRIGEPTLAEAVAVPAQSPTARRRADHHRAGQGNRPLLGARRRSRRRHAL